MSITNNTEFKKAGLALLIYAALFAVAFLLEKIAPSGVCNPGLGFLFSLFLIPIIAFMLLIQNLIMLIGKGKLYRLVFVVHLLAVLVLGACFIVFIR